jgi:hypothetical protein
VRERRLAAQFTDRDLWEVGLRRGDISREFARSFRYVEVGAKTAPGTRDIVRPDSMEP